MPGPRALAVASPAVASCARTGRCPELHSWNRHLLQHPAAAAPKPLSPVPGLSAARGPAPRSKCPSQDKPAAAQAKLNGEASSPPSALPPPCHWASPRRSRLIKAQPWGWPSPVPAGAVLSGPTAARQASSVPRRLGPGTCGPRAAWPACGKVRLGLLFSLASEEGRPGPAWQCQASPRAPLAEGPGTPHWALFQRGATREQAAGLMPLAAGGPGACTGAGGGRDREPPWDSTRGGASYPTAPCEPWARPWSPCPPPGAGRSCDLGVPLPGRCLSHLGARGSSFHRVTHQVAFP